MNLRSKRFLFSLVAFVLLAFYQHFVGSDYAYDTALPKQTKIEVQGVQTDRVPAEVLRVVDGDTIEVLLDDKKQKIRVIGLDTPETVDPRRPVQCFGKEASKYAEKLLVGKTVLLEFDATQGEKDRYDRLLRYIWIENGSVDFGKQMIEQGYSHEYTYDISYRYRDVYKKAEQKAREEKVGLWADTACIKESS